MPDLTLEDFLPSVGDAFEVGEGGDGAALTLTEATALPASVRPGGSFRLEFRGPARPALEQGIYSIRREQRVFDIFIVPLQPDSAGARYEAIFN
jgi:hypothetical protein